MQECSNCGATVRSDARYCTACGTRLNDLATAGVARSWAQVDTVVATLTPSDPSNSQDNDVLDSANDVESESVDIRHSGWVWPSPISDNDQSEGQTSNNHPPSIEISERVSPTTSRSSSEEAGFWSFSPISSTQPISAVDVDDPDVEEDSAAANDTDANEDSTLAAWASTWASDESNSRGAALTAPNVSESADPITRATRLLGELQLLLTEMADMRANSGPGEDDRAFGMLADLLTTLGDETYDDPFADVRQIIDSSRANPRDVHLMMELSNSIERLYLLLEERDHLVSTLFTLRRQIVHQQEGHSGSASRPA